MFEGGRKQEQWQLGVDCIFDQIDLSALLTNEYFQFQEQILRCWQNTINLFDKESLQLGQNKSENIVTNFMKILIFDMVEPRWIIGFLEFN